MMDPRHAPPRFWLIAALSVAGFALAAGCGGGGSSSAPAPGGGGTLPPTVAPTATPTLAPASAMQSLAVGPGLTPSATFSPLPLTAVGTTTLTVSASSANAPATLNLVAQNTLPSGVVAPVTVARRPLSINGQTIVPLAYISAVTTSGSTTMQMSPSFGATFGTALAAPYVYVAQYATVSGWSTIETGAMAAANKSAAFGGFAEPLTIGTNPTWFVIFTVSSALTITPAPNPTSVPTSAPSSPPITGATAAPLPDALIFNATGLYGETIAGGLPAPRQLVALPNGDLLVATDDKSGTVWIVPNADGSGPGGTPSVFTTVPNVATQEPAQGIAFDAVHMKLYIATNQSVWQVPYTLGQQSAPTPTIEIAKVRRGIIAPNSDGDVHFTSSVAVVPGTNMLYVGVGSSCNACVESDPTRGTIQQVDLSMGQSSQKTKAARFRNPLALAVNPVTSTLWAGGAGQDDLLQLNGAVVIGVNNPLDGHPYEFFDAVTAHKEAVPDYGWPDCEENNHFYNPLNKPTPSPPCKSTTTAATNDVVPAVELYAYSTIIGAAFYPATLPTSAPHVFPKSYWGGAFISMHGSWHENANGNPLAVPQLIFVPIANDKPTIPVDFANSGAQWQNILYGFQDATNGTRVGRPVGLAVGPTGSLFVSDDYAGVIYRIRPGTGPASKARKTR